MSTPATDAVAQDPGRAPLLLALLALPALGLVGCVALYALEGALGLGGTAAENLPFWLAWGLAGLGSVTVAVRRRQPAWRVVLLVLGTLLVTGLLLAMAVLLLASSVGAANTIA